MEIVVESREPGEDVQGLYEYPRDCFPFGDPESAPTSEPIPTATIVPTQTPVPDPNSFTLLTTERMCAYQSFHATWSAANVTSLQFSLTNTSDDWTSGWLDADPAAGAFNAEVDHHSYDKVMANATFEDGTNESVSANVGTCTEAAAPPPPSSGSSAVTSLPSTGSGDNANTIAAMSALMLLATTLVMAGTIRKRS